MIGKAKKKPQMSTGDKINPIPVNEHKQKPT
jgi:hypothetical protein